MARPAIKAAKNIGKELYNKATIAAANPKGQKAVEQIVDAGLATVAGTPPATTKAGMAVTTAKELMEELYDRSDLGPNGQDPEPQDPYPI